jgi:O-antigen/teichoic acid export membrane protein
MDFTSSRIGGRPWKPISSWRTAAASWAGKGVLALADQGLIAASNFLLALLLARQLVPAQYGAYALALEVFLLLAVFYSSFVLEPMSVFGPSTYRDCMPEYLGVILRVHLWITVTTMVLVGGAAWLIHEFGGADALAVAMAGVAVAGPCVLLFWVARRAFYIKLAPGSAVLGAVVYCAVILAGLLLCYREHLLSPMVAFVLMAGASLITAPALLLKLKPALRPVSGSPSTAEVAHCHWTYGRWALASSGASWAMGAVFYFSLTSFHGLAAAGEFKALLNLSSPASQGFAALSLLSLPYASRIHHAYGRGGVSRLTERLTLLYMGGTAVYFAILILLREPVLRWLYAGRYLEVAGLVPWVAVALVLRIGATAQAIPLRAVQSPASVFAAYGSAALVAVLVGIPATWALGLRGAVLASALTSATAMVAAYVLLHRKLRQLEPISPELQAA